VTDLQFVAAIVSALAWPVAAVVAAGLLRKHLSGVIPPMESLEFHGAKATFAALPGYGKMVAAAAKDAGLPEEKAIARQEVTEFSVAEALVSVAPGQAIIEAWGLLEYQLNVASDRLSPDQPTGWPQVARNLERWEPWPLLRPVVEELRRLRDYTVHSSRRPPSKDDAARYVSVAQDVATTLRSAFPPIEPVMVTHE
jgi:hypothetical protein